MLLQASDLGRPDLPHSTPYDPKSVPHPYIVFNAGNTIRATKNHRRRTLELPRLLIPTLERRKTALGPTPELPALADRELDARPFDGLWLLQTSTGRPPSLTAYNRALAKACATTGSPKVSSHGLRHTYVSWMIDEGYSADKIA